MYNMENNIKPNDENLIENNGENLNCENNGENVNRENLKNKIVNCLRVLKYKIPNIIHYTFKNDNIPQSIKNIIEHNKRVCKKCKFIFYNDEDIDNFIRLNFDNRVYSAFKRINPIYGAMKADFFRYCVLYKIGGIYIDIKSKINIPIFRLIKPNDICLLDLPRNNMEVWRRNAPTYEQWLLIFAPNHPYLSTMIDLMVYYINIKYIPRIRGINNLTTKQKILNITGPDAFAKAINICCLKRRTILHKNVDYFKYFEYTGDPNYTKMYKMNGTKHYSEWNSPLYL